MHKPEDIRFPDDASESSDSGDENVKSAQPLSHSPWENKSDQLVLSPETSPQEPIIPGDITTAVTDVAVTTQDSLPVPDSTRLSRS